MNQGESKCNNDYSYDVYLDENYLLQLMNQGESKCNGSSFLCSGEQLTVLQLMNQGESKCNTVTISEKCTYSIIVAIDESGRE